MKPRRLSSVRQIIIYNDIGLLLRISIMKICLLVVFAIAITALPTHATTLNMQLVKIITQIVSSVANSVNDVVRNEQKARETCRKNKIGLEYIGKINVTKNGQQCQAWSSQTPHKHYMKDYDPAIVNAGNYCRNPDKTADGPWCYTTDPNLRWEFCDIPYCASKNSQRKR